MRFQYLTCTERRYMCDNNFLEFHKRKYVVVKSFDSQQLQEGARISHYLSPVFTYARTTDTKRKKEEYILNHIGIHLYPVELDSYIANLQYDIVGFATIR